MTRSAASYESEIRYWKQMALTLNQKLQSLSNTPEGHDGGRGLHRDPTGNKAARNVDNQRKRRN